MVEGYCGYREAFANLNVLTRDNCFFHLSSSREREFRPARACPKCLCKNDLINGTINARSMLMPAGRNDRHGGGRLQPNGAAGCAGRTHRHHQKSAQAYSPIVSRAPFASPICPDQSRASPLSWICGSY